MNKLEYEKNLIQNVLISVEKLGANKFLSSIILTGSFGRNEATYTVSEDGKLLLKSDVEIALVFPKSSDKDKVKNLIQDISCSFQEDLNFMAIEEKRVNKVYNFNFSLKTPKYKTIFTFDLFNGSETIWGKKMIEEKSITLNDVDPYEAKRLIANRIGELVYLQNKQDIKGKEYLRKQWKGKLILAIVSSWLICEGEYVSSYHAQYSKVKIVKPKIEKLLGTGFIDEYEKVFLFLRESGNEYEVPDKTLQSYVKRMDDYLKLHNIEKPRVNSISRKAKYCFKYLKSGLDHGFIGFENSILQGLITNYYEGRPEVKCDAEAWHNVLY